MEEWQPKQYVRRVAVVGCGVAGLTAIKACLEEGLEPHCFEMNSDIGGVWYTSDSPKPGGGPQMYDSLITNISKAMMCFSDFPCPPHYPPFLPHKLFQQYLHSYAQHFELQKHITFNTKVLEVAKAEDYITSGRWTVTTTKVQADKQTEEKTTSEFDAVILCQGFYRVPHSPHVPGMKEEFKGKIHHVDSYKNPQDFRDRTVIVVGSASSAGDVACDTAPVAKQVYLSVHHGAYTISRLVNGRTPWDFLLRRVTLNYVPRSLAHRVMVAKASKWLDPVSSGLKPKPSQPRSQNNFIVNDQLPFKIMTGQLKVVAHIEKLTGNAEAHLEDGTVLREIDDIIFATGYKHDFSVIDPSFLSSEPESEKLELYKMTFPLSLPHDTLTLLGCLRANGPIPPLLENQARLAARVISRKHKLPERSMRRHDVDLINSQQLERHGCLKYAFQYLDIADNIATELGIKPNWWHFCLQGDVKMALAVLLGPAHPFHYRLVGPHTWDGARDAIFSAYRETVFATQHRKVAIEEGKERGGSGELRWLLWMVLSLLGLCLAWLCL
ncbi:flavin-containing monooxygenase 2-like [Littorina saxatilis]|uniref:Flavin-containing monooxygenase n=1 Tax=Littorina saxatilis TaxID=31220 RepID=A0AAN9B4D0_9CAEN